MDIKKAHFIGIGGVGMSATAKLLKDSGVSVSGSDEEVYPPISTFLEESKLPFKSPFAAKNIPADVDAIVIGKNARLVPETNPEVAAALASGKKIYSFPEVLSLLAQEKQPVVVAGSYGKSTSSALLSHCLLEAGLDPSFFIGAVPYTPATSAKIGRGALFVLEGDEYPASNTDPRSKFLLMNPHDALVTPLAHDHINVFPTPAEYLKPFEELSSLLSPDGILVVCTEGELSAEYLRALKRPHVTYGVNSGDFTAKDISWGETTRFTIMCGATLVAKIETSLLGEHNVQNIVGVAALIFSKNLMSADEFARGVASFRGIRRRLDKKSEKTIIPIYEGFGSSYEKARSAIAAMKLHFPNKKLVVVFEPNTIVWRSKASLSDYDTAFEGASRVIVYNPPHDGKATELSLEDIVARINGAGISAVGVSDAQEALALLNTELSKETVVLISSSGAMGNLPESIPQLAEKLFPKN